MDKRIVNISSYNRIDSLIKTLKSIYDQCDEINVCLNSHTGDIPEFLYSPKIKLTFTDNSKGDAFKFLYLSESNGYFLTIDDDLIYPPGYVDYIISKCNEYNNEKIVTLHGRSFSKFPILSYYRSASERYSCLNEVKNDVKVQFGGTGVMCFHTSLLKKSINDFLYPNMADVWVGKFAMERNIDIICLKHSSGYLKYIQQKNTIYNIESQDDRIQTKIVNQLFSHDKTTHISVIIPTYNNVKFIDECIYSIFNSSLTHNLEILIGIDGCLETLEYIKNTPYPNQVKFFYFKTNEGPYSIKNTLANIAKADKLLFFDSDDIMNDNMIDETIKGLNRYVCVKPKFTEFDGKSLGGTTFGEGVFGIRKDLFLSMNGFEPWMMAADSDFMGRLYKRKVSILHTKSPLFKRRVHPNSLTNRKDTGLHSLERHRYAKLSKNKKGDGNPPILHTRPYIILDLEINNLKLEQEKNEWEFRKKILNTVLDPQPRKVITKENKKSPPITNHNRLDFLTQKVEKKESITHNNQPSDRQELINKKKSNNVNMVKKQFPKKTNNKESKNMINLGRRGPS